MEISNTTTTIGNIPVIPILLLISGVIAATSIGLVARYNYKRRLGEENKNPTNTFP